MYISYVLDWLNCAFGQKCLIPDVHGWAQVLVPGGIVRFWWELHFSIKLLLTSSARSTWHRALFVILAKDGGQLC